MLGGHIEMAKGLDGPAFRSKNSKYAPLYTVTGTVEEIDTDKFFDSSEFQNVSPFAERLIEAEVIDDVCNYIRYLAIRGKSPKEMYNLVKGEFSCYLGKYRFTYEEFMSWFFSGIYPKLAQAFNCRKDRVLGKLIELGIKVAETNTDNVKNGDFIMEFYDFVDKLGNDVSIQNATSVISEGNYSKQTINTISRLFAEANRFNE